ncbi:MAG: hypothetical protein V1494_01010 [Candidatus Diapherotrites archaeon]
MDKNAKYALIICIAIILFAAAYLLLEKKRQAICGNGAIELLEQCDGVLGCAEGEKCSAACVCEEIVKENAWERQTDASLYDCNAFNGIECGEGSKCISGFEIEAKQENCCVAEGCIDVGGEENQPVDENAGKVIGVKDENAVNNGGSGITQTEPPEITPCDFNAEIVGVVCLQDDCLGEFKDGCCNGYCSNEEAEFAECVSNCLAAGTFELDACREICAS